MSSSSRQFYDLTARRCCIGCPCVHELTPLVEEISAPISSLGLVLDCMGKRHLTDFTGKIRSFGRPVAKGRPKTVAGDFQLHAAKRHQECHIAERLAVRTTRKHKAILNTDRSGQIQRGDSGTRCSRPAFIRSAGTVQTSPSISSQCAPSTSPVRAAVRMANSKASFTSSPASPC